MRNVACFMIAACLALVVSSCGDDASGPTCPATRDCAGRVCGPDPVCMTLCGDCASGETCTAGGACLNTNPTGEEACMQFYQAGCERYLRCWTGAAAVCPSTGVGHIGDVEACYSCYTARDTCAAVFGASTPLNAADRATFDRCLGDLGAAACGAFHDGNYDAYNWPSACSLF